MTTWIAVASRLAEDARRVWAAAAKHAADQRCRHGAVLCEHMRCASKCYACACKDWGEG